MNSTWAPGRLRATLAGSQGLCWACYAPSSLCRRFSRRTIPCRGPPELERDVQFWIRVYTEVNTNSRLPARRAQSQRRLRDAALRAEYLPAGASARSSKTGVTRSSSRCAVRGAVGDTGELSEEDQRIRDLWGAGGDAQPAATTPLDDIRFQLGQADRFRAGLERSGAWQAHIAETLREPGPARRARRAAARRVVVQSGRLFQGGRRGAVAVHALHGPPLHAYRQRGGRASRPFRSTEAAAQLLAYNYRLLGTWPLALTAYNHGAAGMRRAKRVDGHGRHRQDRAATTRARRSASPPAISTSRSSRRSRSTATRKSTSAT